MILIYAKDGSVIGVNATKFIVRDNDNVELYYDGGLAFKGRLEAEMEGSYKPRLCFELARGICPDGCITRFKEIIERCELVANNL